MNINSSESGVFIFDATNLNPEHFDDFYGASFTIFSVERWHLNEVKNLIRLYLLPVLCLTGTITNLLNIIVFASKKLKLKLYKFMLVHSIIDFIYLAISFLYFLVIRRPHWYVFVSVKYNHYLMKLYELIFIRLFESFLTIFSVFTELTISFCLLAIIRNKTRQLHFLSVNFKCLVLSFMLIAALTQLPFLVSNEIVMVNSSNQSSSTVKYMVKGQTSSRGIIMASDSSEQLIYLYEITLSKFGELKLFKTLNSLVSILSGIVAPLVQFIITMQIISSYRKQISNKLKLYHHEFHRNSIIQEYCSLKNGSDEQIMLNNGSANNASSRDDAENSALNTHHHHHHENSRRDVLNNSIHNITKMALIICFLFLSTNVLTSITHLIYLYFSKFGFLINVFTIITFVVDYSAHTLHFIVYFRFNNQFRTILREKFCRASSK